MRPISGRITANIIQCVFIFLAKHMVLRSDRMVVGFTSIGICSLHLINVCIKKNADSNSSLQKKKKKRCYTDLLHFSTRIR